jgi:hypothetical protein
MTMLLLLIGAHYLADFPLQGDHIAKQKGRVFIDAIGFHCLTAHAAIHGILAAAVLASQGAWLGWALVVAVTHWLIDFGKSWERWPDNWRITQGAKWSGNPDAHGLYGINVDQSLHGLVLVAVAVFA